MGSPRHPGERIPKVLSHYRLHELVGSGGMGQVYRATDRRDRSDVAVKLIHPHLASDRTFRERFEREAHFGALLRSPYSVRLLDYGHDAGRYFIVTEFVEGEPLSDLLERGPMEWGRALRLAAQVARALEEAHTRGVTHRDIKPQNVMVRALDGSAKVCDFGIARGLDAATITLTGGVLGTLVYAAPEVAEGIADHRSDIYSLGATLYHMLAGRPPFSGGPIELLRQHRESVVPMEPLAGQEPRVVEIVTRCMQKDPDDRYQSPAELAGDLERAAQVIGTSEGRGASANVQMQLGPGRRGPLGWWTGVTVFPLTIRNEANRALEIQLRSSSKESDYEVSLPDVVALDADESRAVRLRVRPRRRRWRGSKERHQFVVAASGSGGEPPVSVVGQFEDAPRNWMPFAGLFSLSGAIAVLVPLVLLLGGDGNTEQPPTDEDLPKMVLAKEDLFGDLAALTLDETRSGYVSNDNYVSAACDSQEAAALVEQLRRTNGYRALYIQPPELIAFGVGPASIESVVHVYESSDDAIRALEGGRQSTVGQTGCDTVADQTEWDVEPLVGERARGTQAHLRRQAEGGGIDTYETSVLFVRGPTLAEVTMVDVASAKARADPVRDLAERQDERIAAVLAGVNLTTGSPLQPSETVMTRTITITKTATPSATSSLTPTLIRTQTSPEPSSTATPARPPTATRTPTPRPPCSSLVDDSLRDTLGPQFVDIVSASVSEMPGGRLRFEMAMLGEVPDSPTDYLAYVWGLDLDGDGAQNGPADRNVRVAFDPDRSHTEVYGWHAFVDLQGDVLFGLSGFTRSGSTVSATVETDDIVNPDSFGWQAGIVWQEGGDFAPNAGLFSWSCG